MTIYTKQGMLELPVKGVYMITTRDEIIDYMEMCTQTRKDKDIETFSANHVADELKISRSLASQYLNELFKEKCLIKVLTRPVLFFHRNTLEQQGGFVFQQLDFLSLNELQAYLQNHSRQDYAFEDIIGAYGSLKGIIDNFKACMKYPTRGLPLVLIGEKGTGRKNLIRAVYKYMLSQNIIETHSQLIVIDMADLQNKDDILDILFGNSQKKDTYPSQILQSQNGMVYIRNAQYLSLPLIQKIIRYFSPECSDDDLYALCFESTARIVLEATMNHEQQLDMFQDIPIICTMPTLYERYNEEKEAYIYRYFQSESRKIGKKIIVSTNVMGKLMAYQYTDNIDGLENIIQIICANANADHHQEDHLKIYTYHLPAPLLSVESHDMNEYKNELSFIDVQNYQQGQENQQVEKIFDSLLQDTEKFFMSNDGQLDEFMNAIKRHYHQYFEYLQFNKRFDQKQIRHIELSINDIIDTIFENYNVNEPTNFTSLISKSIYFIKENRSFMNTWFTTHHQKIHELSLFIQQSFKNEYEMIECIHLYIYDSLGIKFDEINKTIFTVLLADYIRGIVKKKCLGIIVSHGYSTATSISDAVNTMIGRHVFDSIDMPIETTTHEIVEKIKQYLVRVVTKNDLLVMVDMGSLQDIGESLMAVAQSDIGVINHVSTGLALEAGYLILRNESLKHILEKVNDISQTSYRLIENTKRKPAIIFISENGVNTARRLSELFIRSLPKNIDVDILTYDYFELMDSIQQTDVFEKKNILFIFGVSDPKIPEISFVSLEDIMSMNKVDELYSDFSIYLTAHEINEFKRNLMKNFSLENVMKHLTILEPTRLIESVSESIEKLQKLLNVEFSNQTIMGLYIHISCLIERLVTKEALDYGDVTKFALEHADFISHVKTSFENIFRNYGIDLPLSEMSYLYDYISIDSPNHITRQKRGLL